MSNDKPKVFIGSSKEKKEYANKLQSIISDWSDPEVWFEIFDLSELTIETLEKKLPKFDMCVFLWTSDDTVKIRNQEMSVARDNLIFETGLSYAYIGRKNTIIVTESDTRIISDLFGLTVIIHDFTQSMNIVATKLNTHYTENKKKPGLNTGTTSIKKGLDFEAADEELKKFGEQIRRRLENFMLDDDQENFKDCLKKYVTEDNNYILAYDFFNIAKMCLSMGLYTHALRILKYAHERFPAEDYITTKLIDVYCEIDNPINKTTAKNIMEEYFCITYENNVPVLTVDSKSRHIAIKDSLTTIFAVYLLDNEYDKLLSIIDSYKKLNIQAKNQMILNSYKAFAKKQKGEYEEAISLYKEIVMKYPNENDLRNLGAMFFETGEIEIGYQIYELMALTWFECDSLLRLASKMSEYRICRTENGLQNTQANKPYTKKVIVPILFKAIDLSPNEDTVRRVKSILRYIGGREEFEFIMKNNHVPQEMYSILHEERFRLYEWFNLEYIEKEKMDLDNINELNKKLTEKVVDIIKEETKKSIITEEE